MSIERREKPERRIGLLVIVIFLAFAALFGFWGYKAWVLYFKAVRSNDWERTKATVTGWELVATTQKRGSPTYEFYCRYAYEVNGVEYVGSSIKISPFGNKVYVPSQRVDRLNERYQVGSTCDVWYDPADPADSVLEPGTAPWEPLEFAYRYAWVVTVGLILLSGWGLRRKRGKASLNS